MLTIQDVPTFTRTVTVNVPVDGGFKKETFDVSYAVLPTDRFSQLDLTTEQGVRDFLVDVILGFDGVVDENEKEIPYSDKLRDTLIGLPYVRTALAAEYFRSVGGSAEGN